MFVDAIAIVGFFSSARAIASSNVTVSIAGGCGLRTGGSFVTGRRYDLRRTRASASASAQRPALAIRRRRV